MINETLEANRAYQRDKDDAYNRGYKQGKADAEPQWIPCSERLPETDDPVLITLYDGTVCEAIFIYHTHDQSYWVKTESGYDYECNEVTAWMPLPEPYKEDNA